MHPLVACVFLFLLCGFSVHDGDTFTMDSGQIIRLWGVDAPEMQNDYTNCPEQLCKKVDGTDYRCAAMATDFLQHLLKGKNITCYPQGISYGRMVGDCYAGDIRVSAEMARSGWAIEETYYSHGAFTDAEHDARLHHRGIWQGKFQNPYRFRKKCQQ